MFHPDQMGAAATDEPGTTVASTRSRPGCLVAGCACKDARIVSHRRAGFFAAVARRAGETADRVIAPDPDWAFSTGAIA